MLYSHKYFTWNNRTSKEWHTFLNLNQRGMNKGETVFWNLWLCALPDKEARSLCNGPYYYFLLFVHLWSIVYASDSFHNCSTRALSLSFPGMKTTSQLTTQCSDSELQATEAAFITVKDFFQHFQSQDKFVVLKLSPLNCKCTRSRLFISFVMDLSHGYS